MTNQMLTAEAVAFAALSEPAQRLLLDLHQVQARMTDPERALAASLLASQSYAIGLFLTEAAVAESVPASELISTVVGLLFVHVPPNEVGPDGH